MTKSAKIRNMAHEGMSTADIARKMGIRYQHAYNVLKSSGLRTGQVNNKNVSPKPSKPALEEAYLRETGFVTVAKWALCDVSGIRLDRHIEDTAGVYAFSIDGIVQYVGLANMGLKKRMKFYAKPGKTQTTNIRLKGLISKSLTSSKAVQVLAAYPPDFEWNDLPIHGSTGLEFGLIKRFDLPWNKRHN